MFVLSGQHRDLELMLVESIPIYLEPRDKKVSGHCACLCPTTNQNLFCGRQSSIDILDSITLSNVKTLALPSSNVNGVALHKQGYVTLHWENGKNYIILYSPELKFMKLFGEFFRSTDKYSQLAASKSQVIALDPDEKQLNVYNQKGEFQFNTKLTGNKRPWGVHSLSDGTVLVTDFLGGCLRKYKLAAGRAEPIWTCLDLVAPVGIATDSSGLIFVTSFNGKRIYVISPEGRPTPFSFYRI